MFERFTDRARRVVVLAQEEARQLQHDWIGTEHLLLALIAEGEGVAARAFTALGVDVGVVRAQVRAAVGQGARTPSGHIPFTPRAKKVLELSLREALQLGHNYIGTEHILLGLVREGEGVGAQTLTALGLELTRVRQQVIQILATTVLSGRDAPPPSGQFDMAYARIQEVQREFEDLRAKQAEAAEGAATARLVADELRKSRQERSRAGVDRACRLEALRLAAKCHERDMDAAKRTVATAKIFEAYLTGGAQ